MFGSVVKTYYAEKMGINPQNIVVASIMPCTAKKNEILRPEHSSDLGKDVDITITVRELAKLLKLRAIDYPRLAPSDFDKLLGESSGAGVIFGNTVGVMEAALRTVADKVTGQDLENINYEMVRGLKGIKTATLTIAGNNYTIAVASGLANVRKLMEDIKAKKFQPHFVEIMSCPGGCINGGGMPRKDADTQNYTDVRINRVNALYANDQAKTIRKSHKNPEILDFYEWQKTAKRKAHLHTR